jgi:hypothetical protein
MFLRLKMSSYRKRSSIMRKFLAVAAIASLPLVNAGAAWAQAAVGEPGLAAFYHPDADLLHAGPGYSRAEPRDALAAVPVAKPPRRHSVRRTD